MAVEIRGDVIAAVAELFPENLQARPAARLSGNSGLPRLRRGTPRRDDQNPIPAGHHSVRARIDWTGSKPVDFCAAPGAEIAFRVASRRSASNWREAFLMTDYLLLVVA
jgi:hypothetical protein